MRKPRKFDERALAEKAKRVAFLRSLEAGDTIKIPVMRHHIEKGICGDKLHCMRALAAHEAWPEMSHFSYDTDETVFTVKGERATPTTPEIPARRIWCTDTAKSKAVMRVWDELKFTGGDVSGIRAHNLVLYVVKVEEMGLKTSERQAVIQANRDRLKAEYQKREEAEAETREQEADVGRPIMPTLADFTREAAQPTPPLTLPTLTPPEPKRFERDPMTGYLQPVTATRRERFEEHKAEGKDRSIADLMDAKPIPKSFRKGYKAQTRVPSHLLGGGSHTVTGAEAEAVLRQRGELADASA